MLLLKLTLPVELLLMSPFTLCVLLALPLLLQLTVTQLLLTLLLLLTLSQRLLVALPLALLLDPALFVSVLRAHAVPFCLRGA